MALGFFFFSEGGRKKKLLCLELGQSTQNSLILYYFTHQTPLRLFYSASQIDIKRHLGTH